MCANTFAMPHLVLCEDFPILRFIAPDIIIDAEGNVFTLPRDLYSGTPATPSILKYYVMVMAKKEFW